MQQRADKYGQRESAELPQSSVFLHYLHCPQYVSSDNMRKRKLLCLPLKPGNALLHYFHLSGNTFSKSIVKERLLLQYNKVEICGVNTSQLTVLTEEQKRELLRTIHNGTESEKKRARDKMIEGNLRLVLSVIQRFSGRGENADDLFQVGVIGLIKAIDHFDCTMDVKFSTYGVPMTYGG